MLAKLITLSFFTLATGIILYSLFSIIILYLCSYEFFKRLINKLNKGVDK